MAGFGGDELAPFVLKDAEVAGLKEGAEREEKQTGAGAYGYVFKVRVGGVERIAKKLHSAYVNQVSVAEKQGITSKFRNECIILSKLRHPNVVQFIGVHYGRRGRTDLTLIMECVSSDMDKFLTTHPNIPLPLKLSILQDISFGLVYLHECEPPIIHRDLTARNVLISDKLQAKIADLGVAKIVDIKAQLATSHTQTPGHQFYMPPEALKEKAACTPKLDIFSFGHLTLYTINQELPSVFDITDTLTIKMKEEGIIQRIRRDKSINKVGEDHCLYPIITDCLFDNPDQRPTTRELNNRLCLLVIQNPREETVRQLEQLEAELMKNKQRAEGAETEISDLKKQIHELELARNEAVGDAAAAKMETHQAKIYEEATEEISTLKQECKRLKVEHARNEARLQHEVERLRGEVGASQTVVAHLKGQMGNDKDELKYEIQQRQALEEEDTPQFQKLTEQLEVSQQHSEQLQRRLEASEANLQAQVSQSKYHVGDKEKVIAQLQEDKRKLEDEVYSKMQQVKQYKKQAHNHMIELSTFKDVQKIQINQMVGELSTLSGKVEVLQRENEDLKARERHSIYPKSRHQAGGISPSLGEKIMDLERVVQLLQAERDEEQILSTSRHAFRFKKLSNYAEVSAGQGLGPGRTSPSLMQAARTKANSVPSSPTGHYPPMMPLRRLRTPLPYQSCRNLRPPPDSSSDNRRRNSDPVHVDTLRPATNNQVGVSYSHILHPQARSSIRAKGSMPTRTATEMGKALKQWDKLFSPVDTDSDISDMEPDVLFQDLSEHKPFDENLTCPMCGKRHRIGEIQKFRIHVSDCDEDCIN